MRDITHVVKMIIPTRVGKYWSQFLCFRPDATCQKNFWKVTVKLGPVEFSLVLKYCPFSRRFPNYACEAQWLNLDVWIMKLRTWTCRSWRVWDEPVKKEHFDFIGRTRLFLLAALVTSSLDGSASGFSSDSRSSNASDHLWSFSRKRRILFSPSFEWTNCAVLSPQQQITHPLIKHELLNWIQMLLLAPHLSSDSHHWWKLTRLQLNWDLRVNIAQ